MTGSINERRNLQVEGMLRKWGLDFILEPEYALGHIHTDATQQVRDAENIANKATVNEYLTQFRAGAEFPPIVLRHGKGSSIGVMVDGNTRVAMAREAGLTTFPAYLVEIPTSDIARAIGAQLNQMSGVRLTPNEAKRAASDMMTSGSNFSDANIAMATGTSPQQVRLWRLELQAHQHAERTGVTHLLNQVRPGQRKALGKVQMDRPYKALVELAASGIPNAEVTRLVSEINAATSEEDAVAVVEEAASELRPVGPTREAVVLNAKARRMRMVLPQVLNLAPPLDLYEETKAVQDRQLWVQVRRMADSVLAMYDDQGTGEPPAALAVGQ